MKILKELFCKCQSLKMIKKQELQGFEDEKHLEIIFECRNCDKIRKIEFIQ